MQAGYVGRSGANDPGMAWVAATLTDSRITGGARDMRLSRPVSAAALLETDEMRLRYPGEVELRRGGADEGEGRGFDNLDLSAAASGPSQR